MFLKITSDWENFLAILNKMQINVVEFITSHKQRNTQQQKLFKFNPHIHAGVMKQKEINQVSLSCWLNEMKMNLNLENYWNVEVEKKRSWNFWILIANDWSLNQKNTNDLFSNSWNKDFWCFGHGWGDEIDLKFFDSFMNSFGSKFIDMKLSRNWFKIIYCCICKLFPRR